MSRVKQINSIFAAQFPTRTCIAAISVAFLLATNRLKASEIGCSSDGCYAEKPAIVLVGTEVSSLSAFMNLNYLSMTRTVNSQSSSAINERQNDVFQHEILIQQIKDLKYIYDRIERFYDTINPLYSSILFVRFTTVSYEATENLSKAAGECIRRQYFCDEKGGIV